MAMPAAAAASDVVPTTGLAWACRLLFEAGGVTVRQPGRAASQPAGAPLESFLALPNPARTRLLVPLGSPAAAAAAVRRSGTESGWVRRLTRRSLALGLRAGLGPHLGHRLDVVADPAIGPGPPAALLRDHLREVLGRPDLELAVILGPPRLNRKPVLQLLDHRGGVIGFAKAAWNDLTRRLVRNEAFTLAALGEATPSAFVAPRLLHHGTWGGLELVVTSALAPAVGGHRRRPDAPPLPAAQEIARRGGVSEAPLAESPYWARVRARLAERAPAPAGADDPLGPLVARVEDRHGGTRLRFGAWHGDFTSWNMSGDGHRIGVWDWERADGPVPLGLDLAHFVFQGAVRHPRRDPGQAIEWSRHRTGGLLDRAGLDPGSEEALWLLYGLELLFRYDEARLAGVLARPSAVHAAVLHLFTASME